MRYIRDIQNPQFKISLFQWNGKYIIKIEAGGHYEQVYKIDEMELSSEEDINTLLDGEFLLAVTQRFERMHDDLQSTLKRNDLSF